MDIKNSPDIFQATMQDLLGDPEHASTCIDDVLITGNGSFNGHLKQVKTVLRRPETAGFRANV